MLNQEKVANVLTAMARKHIAKKNFALPGGRYPIEDAAHARNALARVAQNGSPAEQAKVEAKVHRKYHGISKEAAHSISTMHSARNAIQNEHGKTIVPAGSDAQLWNMGSHFELRGKGGTLRIANPIHTASGHAKHASDVRAALEYLAAY